MKKTVIMKKAVTMKKAVSLAGLMTSLLMLGSCGGDHGVGPQTFALTLKVVDPQGRPVTGLDLSVAADLPYYQDGLLSPAKASVRLPFTIAIPCSLSLDIEDIEGTVIRELARQTFPAGRYQDTWDGRDDQGRHMASGVYSVHMRALERGSATLLFEDRKPMYMARISARDVSVGTTNDDGLIKITDRRLFPCLYPDMTITATDENDDPVGLITFSGSMRFELVDPVNGGTMRYYEVVDGPGDLRFVWAPPAKAPAGQATVVSSDMGKRDEPPADVFALGLPYPNPFN